MRSYLKISLLMVTLLVSRAGYSQLIKVSVDGVQRWSSLENVITSNGPMQVSTFEKHYSYGLTASYESGNNGIEVGLLNFPYRLDLRFKGFLNTQVNPSNISLFSALYKRKILAVNKYGVDVYALAGFGFGRYTNAKITEGVGTVSVNGSTVYSGHLDRFSSYDRSTVLLPIIKLEIDKSLSNHFAVGVQASYLFKNWFGYSKPLEEGNYSYSYYQNSGSGKLSDYGNGLLIGVSVKYLFHL